MATKQSTTHAQKKQDSKETTRYVAEIMFRAAYRLRGVIGGHFLPIRWMMGVSNKSDIARFVRKRINDVLTKGEGGRGETVARRRQCARRHQCQSSGHPQLLLQFIDHDDQKNDDGDEKQTPRMHDAAI